MDSLIAISSSFTIIIVLITVVALYFTVPEVKQFINNIIKPQDTTVVQPTTLPPTIEQTTTEPPTTEQPTTLPPSQQGDTTQIVIEKFDNKFTSDVRDVNNTNYESYVFGGKITK
jgi:predicted PurR-regulated permease PerM